jgi:hypothetical protein
MLATLAGGADLDRFWSPQESVADQDHPTLGPGASPRPSTSVEDVSGTPPTSSFADPDGNELVHREGTAPG